VQDKRYGAHEPYWSSFCIEEECKEEEDPDRDRGEDEMSKNLIREEDVEWFKVGGIIYS